MNEDLRRTLQQTMEEQRMGMAGRTAEEELAKYREFLASKLPQHKPSGFEVAEYDLNPALLPFQKYGVGWSLRLGKAGLYEPTGAGKTFQELEWGRHVIAHTQMPVIHFTPLAVAEQTRLEGEKFGIPSRVIEEPSEVHLGINITNYDRMERFDPSLFSGIVLDEASVLRDMSSKTTTYLTEAFRNTPYKLCASATPSPNNHMELGTQAEFLNVMSYSEMLSMFFVHDGGNTSEWRLKGHARKPFWRWFATWGLVFRKPSDLGYSDEGFNLPPLHIHEHVVSVDYTKATEGMLYRVPDLSATGLHKEMRLTALDRAAKVAEIIATDLDAHWLVWCNTDYEAQEIRRLLKIIEVKGSTPRPNKIKWLIGFAIGDIKDLLSKPKIAGFGMNFQVCHKMVFVGLSYSFEELYQAIRRCWRYGQIHPVDAHIVFAETEGPVMETIRRKERDYEEMQTEMNAAMKDVYMEIRARVPRTQPTHEVVKGNGWTVMNEDSVVATATMQGDSIHHIVSSCPFGALYIYSDADADMGNCQDLDEFLEHYRYLVKNLFRVLMPGRLMATHCMNLPSTKEHHGVIGLRDFRGDLIRLFQSEGFIYHSEVCIWKDPLVAMQRTKALGLLHKQIVKDSAMSRQGIADYLVVMRKPGDNPEPVTHSAVNPNTGAVVPVGFDRYIGVDPEPLHEHTWNPATNKYSHYVWQRYASPVWMDIDPSDTLQRDSIRQDADERHIAVLQKQVISRSLELWSNAGDLVLDPFGGIGSTAVVAIQEGRKAISIELKPEYHTQAVSNCRAASAKYSVGTLFDKLEEPA